MPDRRFSDEEVARLMNKIAALQAGANSTPEGVSLAQLRQATAELGIDDSTFETAVRDLDTSPSGSRSIWGGPTTIQLDRMVDGSVGEDAWPEIIGEIRDASGLIGEAKMLGNSLEWRGGDPRFHVSLSPSGGRTRIKVQVRCIDYAVVFYLVGSIMLTMASFVTCAVLHMHLPEALVFVALTLLVGLTAIRSAYNALCRATERRANRIMTGIEGHLTKSNSPLIEGSISEPETSSRTVSA